MNREEVLSALSATEWAYVPYCQSNVLDEMALRIARTGRLNRSLISYSNLVAGITFQFSNVLNGAPFIIDTHNWQGLHRRIVEDCLGYISYVSYRDHDFMASALVAGLAQNRPSDIFFEWMVSLGVIPNLSDRAIEEFWVGEVNKAIQSYGRNPQGFPLI